MISAANLKKRASGANIRSTAPKTAFREPLHHSRITCILALTNFEFILDLVHASISSPGLGVEGVAWSAGPTGALSVPPLPPSARPRGRLAISRIRYRRYSPQYGKEYEEEDPVFRDEEHRGGSAGSAQHTTENYNETPPTQATVR